MSTSQMFHKMANPRYAVLVYRDFGAAIRVQLADLKPESGAVVEMICELHIKTSSTARQVIEILQTSPDPLASIERFKSNARVNSDGIVELE